MQLYCGIVFRSSTIPDFRSGSGDRECTIERSEDRHNGMGYTYVLKCIDNSYYVGSTRLIKDRLRMHSIGGVKYTKSRLPVRLVFLKQFGHYTEAYEFEMKIKSWKKRKSIERMISKSDNIAEEYCGIV